MNFHPLHRLKMTKSTLFIKATHNDKRPKNPPTNKPKFSPSKICFHKKSPSLADDIGVADI